MDRIILGVWFYRRVLVYKNEFGLEIGYKVYVGLEFLKNVCFEFKLVLGIQSL